MTDNGREMFAAAMRADPVDLGLATALLAAEADPSAGLSDTLSQLDALAALARPLVAAAGREPAAQAEALRQALGEQAGFHGVEQDYSRLEGSLLPAVLRRRSGLPILLSVVWVEVARRLDVAAFPIAIPGHVLVGIGPVDVPTLVDPFAGGRLVSGHDVAGRIRDAGSTFHRELLRPTPGPALVLRVLSNVRLLAARSGDARTQLWAVELSLLIPGHPTALHGERAETLARTGDFLGAAAQWTDYADRIARDEPAAAAAARVAAVAARARLN